MVSLLLKELKSFFSTLTGYIVIIVFLLINSLFIWIFPGEFNVLESGYATMSSLFVIAPWVFMFLVPAVTMRLFSEEQRTGTIELLLTKPLSDLQIVLAKYFSGILLVIFSIIPTLVFFVSIWLLGDPQGNLDTGATWGAYIGLFFLASIYTAIGIFASSLTDNQIISFILGMVFSLLFYIGFESISQMFTYGSLVNFIAGLGINMHYESMSRGVIDLRDIVYFTAVVAIFILLTKLKLESRKW